MQSIEIIKVAVYNVQPKLKGNSRYCFKGRGKLENNQFLKVQIMKNYTIRNKFKIAQLMRHN
jgi:hypothetical protein